MQTVWDRTPYKGEKLLVLLALADWSNDDGICWPSVPKIAEKARISRRGAQLILKQLANDGAISLIEKGIGRGNVTQYLITPLKGEPASPIKGKGERGAPIKKANQTAQKANVEAVKGELDSTPYKEGTTKEPPRNRHQPATQDLSAPPNDLEGGESERGGRRDLLFEAVAEACGVDWKICTDEQRGMVNQTCGILRREGRTPEQVQFVASRWYEVDWRGRKGSAPTPHQLREFWGRAFRDGPVGVEASNFAVAQRMIEREERRESERTN